MTTPVFSMDTVAPECNLTTPNGSEEWYIGDTHDIEWTASDSNFDSTPIQLFWSADNGTNWLDIENPTANTGTYAWQIPARQTVSTQVKMSAIDLFGNTTDVASGTFSITYVPPKAPEDIDMQVLEYDAVITWRPVTQTLCGTPITPDGYIVLYSEEADSTGFYFLAETADTTHTHLNVARHREDMYYSVIAFKDYDGRMREILAELNIQPQDTRNRERPIAWADVKKRLDNAIRQSGRRNEQ